ncbi:MAG: 30S ribosomal protein S16 [Candidatus Brocadiia bacterium]
MVRIRLTRTGRKHVPRWRIGVFEKKTRRDGDAVEYLGYFNPTIEEGEERLQVDTERAEYWLSKGAQPTETVGKLLEEAGMEL